MGSVGGVDTGKQGAHAAGGEPRRGGSQQNAGRAETGRVAQNHADDVAALRAEREAHADFLGAAGYGEREQAVNPDGGEQEGDSGEGAERAGLYGARLGFGFDDIGEHAHVGDGQLGISRQQ